MTRIATVSGVALLAVLAAACADEPPSNTLRVSGHVEATEIQVSGDVGGRILDMRVTEGDRVAAGDVVATLDTRDIELQIERARAERSAADAQLRFIQRGARAEDIRQAEAQVDAAGAEAAAAAADLKAAETDLARFESLLAANAGSQKQRDDAAARVAVARERERGARDRTRGGRETVARLKAGATREEVEAARARVAVVDAQIAALEKARADAVIKAPAAGLVTQTLVDAGEVIGPRMPLVIVTDIDNAWANLFVPEPSVPRIAPGQAAVIITDAGNRLDGKVSFIARQAEFTPRNVQTADERSRLVYRIKIAVDNRNGILKPGMPVDAELALQ